MKRFITPIRSVMLAAGLLICGLAAQAQIPFLDMEVTPDTQTVAPGASPFWDIQFTNNNSDTAYFTFTGFDDGLGAVPGITIPAYDPAPFGQNYTLAPNASLSIHDLFQTQVSSSAGSSSYTSTAESIYDLFDSSSFSSPLLTGVTASADWALTVEAKASSTPEPGSLPLLVGATVTGSVFFLRRRRRSVPARSLVR